MLAKRLKEREIYMGSWFEVIVSHGRGGMIGWWELEAAAYMSSTVTKQR